MSDFFPIGASLFLIIMGGIVFPFVLDYFVDADSFQTSVLADSLSSFVTEGYTIEVLSLEFNINPFGVLPDSIEESFGDAIIYLGILPNFLLISILIFVFVSLGYGIFRLIRG